MRRHWLLCRRIAWLGLTILLLAGVAAGARPAAASRPAMDRATARFEVRFMTGMIDHHQMAIEMAESRHSRQQPWPPPTARLLDRFKVLRRSFASPPRSAAPLRRAYRWVRAQLSGPRAGARRAPTLRQRWRAPRRSALLCPSQWTGFLGEVGGSWPS
jgi:hypothetical protein